MARTGSGETVTSELAAAHSTTGPAAGPAHQLAEGDEDDPVGLVEVDVLSDGKGDVSDDDDVNIPDATRPQQSSMRVPIFSDSELGDHGINGWDVFNNDTPPAPAAMLYPGTAGRANGSRASVCGLASATVLSVSPQESVGEHREGVQSLPAADHERASKPNARAPTRNQGAPARVQDEDSEGAACQITCVHSNSTTRADHIHGVAGGTEALPTTREAGEALAHEGR